LLRIHEIVDGHKVSPREHGRLQFGVRREDCPQRIDVDVISKHGGR
jgi:hypothetical protein